MNDGFLRIAAATPEVRVADCVYNSERIIDLIYEAGEKGAALVAFPELCITSYTCGDLFLHESLLRSAEERLLYVCEKTRDLDVISVLGVPLKKDGSLFNCAAVVYRGGILGAVAKVNLPNYSEFYERRYFSSEVTSGTIKIGDLDVRFGKETVFSCGEIREFKFGVEICEDLWSVVPPSCAMAREGANVILNLSASDEYLGKSSYRRDLVRMQSARLICAYVYASSGKGESSTDVVFSGSDIISENGEILAESETFSTGLICADVDLKKIEFMRRRSTEFPASTGADDVKFSYAPKKLEICREFSRSPFISEKDGDFNRKCEEVITLQSVGLETRIASVGCEKVVLGLSGGLDSTLAALACVRAFDRTRLPRKGIIGVTMPCFGTSERTFRNAVKLASALGITLREIPIGEAVKRHFYDIGLSEEVRDVVYENVQARERTQVLMSIANKERGIVVGTGDLSELAVGWTTYNGDHISMYALNASVPKTMVRSLTFYEAQKSSGELKDVLLDILDAPISPELIPASPYGETQRTENFIGPYELIDFFLYYFLGYAFPPKKIFRIASLAFKGKYEGAEIKKWLCVFLKRFFRNQFKRSCMPDSPKVTFLSVSPRGDFRMPSDASVRTWLEEAENIET